MLFFGRPFTNVWVSPSTLTVRQHIPCHRLTLRCVCACVCVCVCVCTCVRVRGATGTGQMDEQVAGLNEKLSAASDAAAEQKVARETAEAEVEAMRSGSSSNEEELAEANKRLNALAAEKITLQAHAEGGWLGAPPKVLA